MNEKQFSLSLYKLNESFNNIRIKHDALESEIYNETRYKL